MSNSPSARRAEEAPEAVPAETTVVRADPPSGDAQAEALHPLLRAQLRELRLRTGTAALDLKMLLKLVSSHYELIDQERRGIVRSMQLMADEARTFAWDSFGLDSNPLQVILDNIKETVLTVDEQGMVRTFNPTGERVFGYEQRQVIGQSLALLAPQIADRGSVAEGLLHLAAATGDTGLDLAPHEIWGRRQSGEVFPAEIAVSRVRLGRREMFVVCMRDVTERRAAERHLRESEARYRLLVDHAPEAIVVLDAETGRFVDANTHAEQLFGRGRDELLELGPLDLSPAHQLDGTPSREACKRHLERAAAGETQRFEWLVRDSGGTTFVCEVRLINLPSATRRLIRGSLSDISERKRAERLSACEREVLALLAARAPLAEVLESITRLVESVEEGSLCTVSLLAPDGSAKDPLAERPRDPALAAGLQVAGSTPIEAAGGKVLGALGLLHREAGPPSEAQARMLSRAVQLAGIALERTHSEEVLRRAHVTLQSIGDAVISTCARGLIEYLNPVAERLIGWKAEEACGRPLTEVIHLIDEGTRAPIADPVQSLLARESTPTDHPVLVTRAHREIAVQESAAPICDASGLAIGAVFVFRDVTQERRLKRALSYQASHDALTGLINRREFDNRLQAIVTRAQAGESRHALIYVDLDQFKLVNDTCGHQAGDRLMRDITGLLRARVRTSDTIGRLGGDEFGILVGDCTLEQAVHIAEGVRHAIHAYRFTWGTATLSVGASIGVVEIAPECASAASVLSAADIACYAAKEAGRNRVHVYATGGVSTHEREMHWAARVTRAAEEGRLELYFQPIVSISEGRREPFHELTVRLRDEDGRLIMPGEFIPAAERFNVMPSIDRWVVSQAVTLLRRELQQTGASPLLAVNLSGNSLNDPSFLEFVLQQAADGAVARSLCFEITETAAVTNLADAMGVMHALQARGCRFALDDFGSGVSSFLYLKTLPVDFLKIDGQFVNHVVANPFDRSMVEAVGKVGRALGIRTIAECVETPEVLEELKRIGIDFVQGYHTAPPRPIAQLGQ